tara:strand:+ start:458 stop:1417 length:960 start_codon:yes stop_codon:yes gene_type:complete
MKTVSIIIPTVNRPKLIERSINSILEQDYEGPIGCIVVDSSSNNETENLLKNIKKRNKKTNRNFTYIRNQQSKNPIDNWILGTENLLSDYSKFLCDDDWLDKNFVRTALETFQREKVSCVVTNIKLHKKFQGRDSLIERYYEINEGVCKKDDITNFILKSKKSLPVTPSSNLMETNKFLESFYFSLKHFDCTKNLFGFDFLMNYYPVFDKTNTFFIEESLANSWAGDDSMTLNVNMANISYCYFLSFLRLVENFKTVISGEEESLIEHRLGVIRFKSYLSKEIKSYLINTNYKSKLIIRKLILDYSKKIFIKIKYKIKK